MYSIELLAKLTGLKRRSIRFYIEKGLLNPPLGSCRGSYYTEDHLSRLEQIKKWTQQGVALNQIKAIFEGKIPALLVEPESYICTTQWERLKFCEGLEMHFWANFFKPEELKVIHDTVNDVLTKRWNYTDDE